jgi:large subunit ribosomal protein L17
MLSNMAASLLVNKRINTTLAKAKELRKYIEPLITKAKSDTTHARRVVFSYLQDKESVNALFNEVVDRVANRPGGYTRIIKLGTRLGDNAEMAMIELVDFNDLLIKEAEPKKAKTRRSRRGSKSKGEEAVATDDNTVKEEKAEEKKSTAKKEKVVEEKVEQPEEKEASETEAAVEAEKPTAEVEEVKGKEETQEENSSADADVKNDKEEKSKDKKESQNNE